MSRRGGTLAGGASSGRALRIACDNDFSIQTLQERARWGRILEALRLVPRQEEALLALRKQHLARLKQIYQERQSLNMQVRRLSPSCLSSVVPQSAWPHSHKSRSSKASR